MADVLAAIATADTALVFVNTRSQAEMVFRELWALNEERFGNRPASWLAGS